MKKILPIVLLIGMAAALTITYGKLSDAETQLKKGKAEAQKSLSLMEQALIDINSFQWKIEGRNVKPNLLLRDIKGDTISFDKLVLSADEKLTILRFFYDTCEDCQIQEMKFLEKLNNKDIAVIVSYDSFRDFVLYMKSSGVNLRAYQLLGTDVMIEGVTSKINAVFTINVDKERNISSVHSASASFPALSEEYYSILEKKID